jgi:hypothetical protein
VFVDLPDVIRFADDPLQNFLSNYLHPRFVINFDR